MGQGLWKSDEGAFCVRTVSYVDLGLWDPFPEGYAEPFLHAGFATSFRTACQKLQQSCQQVVVFCQCISIVEQNANLLDHDKACLWFTAWYVWIKKMRPGWPLKGLYPKKHSWLCSRGQVLPSSPPNALLLAIKARFLKKSTPRKNRGWKALEGFPRDFLKKPWGSRSCCLWDSLSCSASSSRWDPSSCHHDLLAKKKGGFMVEVGWNCRFSMCFFPNVGFPQPRGRQILRADVAAVWGAQCRKAEMIREEAGICKCSMASQMYHAIYAAIIVHDCTNYMSIWIANSAHDGNIL